jgi:hypothetical protein
MHESIGHTVEGGTCTLESPRGYNPRDENPAFGPSLIVEI